jgi:hypothetical protein
MHRKSAHATSKSAITTVITRLLQCVGEDPLAYTGKSMRKGCLSVCLSVCVSVYRCVCGRGPVEDPLVIDEESLTGACARGDARGGGEKEAGEERMGDNQFNGGAGSVASAQNSSSSSFVVLPRCIG